MGNSASLQVVAELCHLRPAVGSADELLRLMAGAAERHGYVKQSFAEAVIKRESGYPTGLPTPVPAALPHADPEHVLRPGLAVALLDPPVEFGEMASEAGRLGCHLAVMLLVTTPADQVVVLSRLVSVLQRPDWHDCLKPAADADDLAARFAALLG